MQPPGKSGIIGVHQNTGGCIRIPNRSEGTTRYDVERTFRNLGSRRNRRITTESRLEWDRRRTGGDIPADEIVDSDFSRRLYFGGETGSRLVFVAGICSGMESKRQHLWEKLRQTDLPLWTEFLYCDLQYDRCGSKICDLCYRKSDSVGKMSFENADGEISAEQVGSWRGGIT